MWSQTLPIAGASRGAPTVHVRLPALEVCTVRFCHPDAGRNFRYLYHESDDHPMLADKKLGGWGRGGKIEEPEWDAARPEAPKKGGDPRKANSYFRAAFLRSKPVSFRVTLRLRLKGKLTKETKGVLRVTPKLDGKDKPLQPASKEFTLPAGARTGHTVELDLTLGGAMPDDVGRYLLVLKWRIEGERIRLGGSGVTWTLLYSLYDEPIHPDDPDFTSPLRRGDQKSYKGTRLSFDDGTLSGTRKRLDKLFSLLGKSRTHPPDKAEILWKLHVGISDSSPPFFDGGHTKHITNDGTANGKELPVEDQCLMWVDPGKKRWNDASCIGHVQLLKTMAASIGILVRRAWVAPHTSRLPRWRTAAEMKDMRGNPLGAVPLQPPKEVPEAERKVEWKDEDLYSLDVEDDGKWQHWNFAVTRPASWRRPGSG